MLRVRSGKHNRNNVVISRNGPYPFVSDRFFPFPLRGVQQHIDEPTLAFGAKRPHFDKTGYTPMNPVVINKVTSVCPDSEIPMATPYGTVTIKGCLHNCIDVNSIMGSPYYDGKFKASYVDVLRGSQRLVNQATINCLKQLNSPKFLDAGVGLAELRESLHFLRNPLGSIRKLANSFTHDAELAVKKYTKRESAFSVFGSRSLDRNVGQLSQDVISTAADTWLGYRYAFSPLARDATGIMIEMSETYDRFTSKLRSAHGKSESVITSSKRPFVSMAGGSNVNIYWNGTVTHTREQFVSATQLYRYKPYNVDAIRLASLGLSPTQVLSVAWEKIPFSFVADWFVNVGDWLQSWAPTPWVEYLNSCVSHRTHDKYEVCRLEVSTDGSKFYPVPGYALLDREQLVRDLATLTTPFLPIMTSGLLSFNQTLDSLSLGWRPLVKVFSNLRS